MPSEMATGILLLFAGVLALFALNGAFQVCESHAEGDVGLMAVRGVNAVACAAGAIALAAIAIGRLG